MSDEEFQGLARESIEEFSRREVDDKVLSALLEGARYVSGSFDDGTVYERLDGATKELDEEAGIAFNRIYYLSTAPSFFPVIVGQLGEHGLDHHEGSEVRVVIEKPIGTNLREAKELNAAVLDVLDEDQVFRIDHYLGKETVQNVMAFRFANGLFEPIWNRNFIDYVQITAAEDIGIGSRAGYYDTSGALRDLVQNHMLQLLTPAVHGAAGVVLRRRGARREGEGAARDRPARRPSRCRRWRCPPATTPGWWRARR